MQLLECNATFCYWFYPVTSGVKYSDVTASNLICHHACKCNFVNSMSEMLHLISRLHYIHVLLLAEYLHFGLC